MKYRILVVMLSAAVLQVSASDAVHPGSSNAPAPEAEALTASQREAQAVIDKANRLQQQEAAADREKAQAGASARQELERANAELEAAKVVGEGDRQSLAGGGSKLTPEYLNRVQAAEKQVEEAKQKLNQAD